MGFKKREKRREGVKFLVYGQPGTGKSPFGLSFPNQALVDSDSSTTFYDASNVIVETGTLSFKQMNEDLDDLEMDTELFDEIETFSIDSVTRLYNNMQHAQLEIAEERALNAGRNADAEGLAPKDWGNMKLHYGRWFSRMMNYSKLGKNIVVIAEEKDKTEQRGDKTVKVGVMPDAPKKEEHGYDVVLRFYKKDGDDSTSLAKVIKDRTGTFKIGDVVEFANYSHWADAIKRAQSGQLRKKEEIETFDEVLEKERDNLDTNGDQARKKALGIIKLLDDAKKEEAKEQLEKAIGTRLVHKVTDKDKLDKALEILQKLQ